MVNPRVFLDFTVDSEPLGRVVFELFADIVPKTCENFRALCTGEKGNSPVSGIPLHYKGSGMHRCISGFMVQGGDFTKKNGSGGESIYGAPFADEDSTRKIDSEGLLVMANKGPNTNGSQFFIALRPCPHLDGKHVTFGKVVSGYANVVQKIAEEPTDGKDRPLKPVLISHCGELELQRKVQAPAATSKQTSEKRASASRSRSRPRSRSPSRSDDSSTERRREKKRSRKDKDRKKKHHKKRRHNDSGSDAEDVRGRQDKTDGKDGDDAPKEETEEELDARLEREENERNEEARLQRLEEVKKRMEAEKKPEGGVRFKGRGMMKYRDPELGHR